MNRAPYTYRAARRNQVRAVKRLPEWRQQPLVRVPWIGGGVRVMPSGVQKPAS